ncbi:MAG: response regulator [Spirochaetes bacterium]|nr:response regulator [Spirochaetota bacterium]
MGARPVLLVVDDSKLIRQMIRGFLSRLDAEIDEAADGKAGVDAAFARDYDLILTDVEMPVMDGLQFCRALKEMPKTRGLPVIMVSSFDSDDDIERGFLAGAAAYVSKKQAEATLEGVVRQHLTRFDFSRKRLILVVDDSRVIRNFVEEGMAKAGYRVAVVEDGLQALQQLEMETPDLVISDIDMPRMDGFELCRAIRTDMKTAEIPFVVMSSNSSRGFLQRMVQTGAASYIIKPFNIDQLVILVDRLLSDHVQILLADRYRLELEHNLILGSITSLVSALEKRDPYTKDHSENVAKYATGIAGTMGLDKTLIDTINLGGRLHDIGKIGIRDDILLKKTALTNEEFEIIKSHPTKGAEILSPIPSLAEIVSIVLYHHERWDGTGYPERLTGELIPLAARIVAVADTYDALTSTRTYRSALKPMEAFDIIARVKGTQLAPEPVEAFLAWVETAGSLVAQKDE